LPGSSPIAGVKLFIHPSHNVAEDTTLNKESKKPWLSISEGLRVCNKYYYPIPEEHLLTIRISGRTMAGRRHNRFQNKKSTLKVDFLFYMSQLNGDSMVERTALGKLHRCHPAK
jgi:hypothetical protein